jgi:dipeptide/tripeptide permease
MTDGETTWKFSKTFWFSNIIELFERAAYYGCFIFLTVYLTKRVGFTDVETGTITGAFAFFLYLMPTFMGSLADRIGFKSALCMAFSLLTAGYAILGAYPSKPSSIISLILILLGGATVKPVVSGTVAKCSDKVNRARAFSIYYWAVNIGAFAGKSVVDPIRQAFLNSKDSPIVAFLSNILGNPSAEGYEFQYVNIYSASMAFLALLFAIFAYKNVDLKQPARKMSEILKGFGKVLSNWRFLCLIIITGFFWAIQGQLYATMPKYLFRMVGEFAKPGWVANVNPAVVVIFVIFVTQLVRKWKPVNSIMISFLLIPFSALPVALTPLIGAKELSLGFTTVNTIIFMMIIGIAFQGLAECFLSPKYLEFASKQAPPGETGLYMGYSHLNSAFGWLFGFIISGKLLDIWCPDPKTLAGLTEVEKAARYSHAHYIWYVYTGIGILGLILLLTFRYITARIDRNKTQDTGKTD